MKINLKNLNVGNINHSSGVFSGENLQVGWTCYKNINEGFGSMLGNYNNSSKNRHVVQKMEYKNQKMDLEEQK
ncbi:hypothetical protein [Lederbergia citri]|uniref:Uncharacterized protein n=1 Tax=Lederbergia citri TaxID=2833580 RepID=A0A942TBP9_9BACI|nr:hypothetical protein [Lederbergia citri]MBS4193738.1 hypothetical protein [Lederbergia citri]